MAKDARVGFGAIRLNFALDTDASPEQIATLLKLTERYCVVYQTLRQPPEVLVRLEPDATPKSGWSPPLLWRDVLVHPEEVGRVVLLLDPGEPRVVLAVARLHALLALVSIMKFT